MVQQKVPWRFHNIVKSPFVWLKKEPFRPSCPAHLASQRFCLWLLLVVFVVGCWLRLFSNLHSCFHPAALLSTQNAKWRTFFVENILCWEHSFFLVSRPLLLQLPLLVDCCFNYKLSLCIVFVAFVVFLVLLFFCLAPLSSVCTPNSS